MTDTKPAEALLPFIQTTGEMRARLRELSDTTGKDDYDRCVLMLLDDFAQLMAHVAPLADAYRRAAQPVSVAPDDEALIDAYDAANSESRDFGDHTHRRQAREALRRHIAELRAVYAHDFKLHLEQYNRLAALKHEALLRAEAAEAALKACMAGKVPEGYVLVPKKWPVHAAKGICGALAAYAGGEIHANAAYREIITSAAAPEAPR